MAGVPAWGRGYSSSPRGVFQVEYYLAWCVGRNAPVLTGEVATRTRTLIETECAERGWGILLLEVNPTHVCLRVSADPDTTATEVVTACRRTSSYTLLRTFPTIQALRALWTKPFFCSTASDVCRF